MNGNRIMSKRRQRDFSLRVLVVALCGAFVTLALAQAPDSGTLRLKFNAAPIDLLLEAYAEQTGRTLLLAPSLPQANITLRSQGSLSKSEYLEAIETVLGMNGVALLPEGEKFARVVPNKEARQEPMPIVLPDAEGEGAADTNNAALISQMIPLKHIEAAEAQRAIQPLQHSYAQAHVFEGINSLLLTDTAANINRVMQVIAMVDQPIEAREEPIVVQIHYAKASEIKAKLEQILAEAQGEQKSTVQRQRESGAPGVEPTPAGDIPSVTPGGIIRAPRRGSAESRADVADEVDRGIIRGQVKIVDDDRTNILIIITRPENMSFFEKIIKVLDVETSPDVLVRIFRLEFAEAEKIAGMLNDLIGAASPDDKSATTPADGDGDAGETGGGTALRDYVERRAAPVPATPAPTPSAPSAGGAGGVRKSKVGELSTDNIKILSDERTNSLIIMASKSDLVALEEIIHGMDMMLSQVLVEAVIVELSLDDSMQTGVDWVQRALVSYNQGPNGTLAPKVAYAGGGGGGSSLPIDPTTLTKATDFAGQTGAGLSYYLTLFDLNVDMVFKAVSSDSRTRILSSPVILTTDNKEATIEVTQATYFLKGQNPVSTGNSVEYVEDVQRENVGITLSVKPRINEKRFVVMEIEQTLEDVTGSQRIGDTDWPIVTKRKVSADVAVKSGDTIVLGGLVKNSEQRSKSGVPLLGDIPILGIPFRSSSKAKKREEVIVFITPYVMNTPEEIMSDAVRRQDAMEDYGKWKRGWSNSKLAEPRMLGQLQDLGSARGELGYETNALPRIETPKAVPFRSHEDSLLKHKPKVKEPTPEKRAADLTVPGKDMADGDGDGAADLSVPPTDGKNRRDDGAGGQAGGGTTTDKTDGTDVEAGAVEPAAEFDPLDALDPELRKYVEEEEKKYQRSLKRVDRRLEP